MQRQQQTVELRFEHPAPHADRSVEHLAKTLQRERGKKCETKHPLCQLTHTHTRDMDSLQIDRDRWPSVWKDKLPKLQRQNRQSICTHLTNYVVLTVFLVQG